MSWPFVAIGDVAEILSGNAWKSSQFTNESEGRLPIIRIQNISDIATDFIYWDGVVLEKYIIKDGDLLLSLSGNVKLCEWSFGNALLNQRVVKLAPAACIDKRYFYWALHRVVAEIEAMARHAVIANVSVTDLREFQIPLPPLPEQKRIAAILDKADTIRRKRQQAIQLADDFLRAVFLDMFGDPVTNPKGWPVEHLKDITMKIGSGSTPRGGSEAYLEQGISLIRSLNIHDDDFRMKNLAFIDDEQAEKLSNVLVQSGDVLLNITGASVCRCAIVPTAVLPARVNQHVCIIRPSDAINSSYLLHLLISEPYKQKLLKMSGAGATREALTKQQVELLEVPIPPKELQTKFEEIKEKVRSLSSASDSFKEESFFESLSDKAFSGQL